MKTELGKPLTKKQMKEIQGGKFPGCAPAGKLGSAYVQGCCAPGLPNPTTGICS